MSAEFTQFCIRVWCICSNVDGFDVLKSACLGLCLHGGVASGHAHRTTHPLQPPTQDTALSLLTRCNCVTCHSGHFWCFAWRSKART